MEVGPNHSFTRLGSFRQASLTERFEDPQMVMPAAEPVPIKAVDNPHAIERPKPSVDAFTRQNSLRGTLQMPFKRSTAAYTSLKPGELPSFQQQKIASGFNNTNSPLSSSSTSSTSASNAQTKTSLLMQQLKQQQQQSQQQPQPQLTLAELANQSQTSGELVKSDTFSKINTINELPEENLASAFDAINNSTQMSHLSEQLNNQLNIQTRTSPAALPSPIEQTDWTGLNSTVNYQQQLQQQQHQQQSSIFTTPQSLPVTPGGQSAVVATTVNNNVHSNMAPLTPPFQITQPVTHPAFIYQMLQPSNNSTSTTTTSLFPIQQQQQQLQQQAAYTNYHLTSPSSSSLLSSNSLLMNHVSSLQPINNQSQQQQQQSAETFEQKWAKYQAAKKQTNPFAEDIAKKYEIKL